MDCHQIWSRRTHSFENRASSEPKLFSTFPTITSALSESHFEPGATTKLAPLVLTNATPNFTKTGLLSRVHPINEIYFRRNYQKMAVDFGPFMLCFQLNLLLTHLLFKRDLLEKSSMISPEIYKTRAKYHPATLKRGNPLSKPDIGLTA